MEALLLILILSFLLCLPYYSAIQRLRKLPFKPPTTDGRGKRKLPPGPPALVTLVMIPFLTLRLASDLSSIIGKLRGRYGPIVTVSLNPLLPPTIIVTGRELIREALVEKGVAFAVRPHGIEPGPIPIIGAISTATYGRRWRLLRQTLASGILHPSYMRSSLTGGRRWALGILKQKLECRARSRHGVVEVRDALECTVLSLVCLMCYGEKLEEGIIDNIKAVHHQIVSIYNELSFDFLAKLSNFFLGTRSRALMGIRRKHEEVFIPLIRARRAHRKQHQQQQQGHQQQQEYVQQTTYISYLDSLLELRIQDENDCELDDVEIMVACSELLGAAAEQVPTTVEWIFANLVKNPCIQQRLHEEIQRALEQDGSVSSELKEESLEKMEYLNAVVLEGLRRHPSSHLLLPHSVSTEISLGGYVIPKEANLLFTISELGSDGSVWSEPSEFRPERFLPGGEGERVDLTGRRELKMMPFGLGRRTCPSLGFSIPLVKSLVANMVKEFKWESVEGEDVDMVGKLGLAVTMNTALQARISPRRGG